MKPIPTSPAEIARYVLRQPVELERILKEMCRTGDIVTVSGNNGTDIAISRIVEVDTDDRTILLDYGPDENINARHAQCQLLTVTTSQGGVHIQFNIPTPEKIFHGSSPAWRARWPEQILRLQRREYYRLGTSLVNPVRCLLSTLRGAMETTVMDISVGGLAILAYEDGQILRPGQIFHGCRLSLPDHPGEISFSMRIIDTFDLVLKNGRKSHRAGCQFVDLPASMETEIQRYILKTERDRRSRYI